MVCRKASLDDVKHILRVDARAFPDETIEQERWEYEVERGNVLVVGTPVVGFLLLHEDEVRTNFSRLGVDPSEQRKGYGTALLTAGFQHTTGLVSLAVDTGNRRAVSLYERMGFQIVGEEPSQGRSGYYIMYRSCHE